MTAALTTLANAVLAELGRDELAAAFERAGGATCSRAYIPRLRPSAADGLRVFVVQKSTASVPQARHSADVEVAVDIGFVKYVAPDSTQEGDPNQAELDALVELVELVRDHFMFAELDGFDGQWRSGTSDPAYDPTKLAEDSVFFSVITLTYGLQKGA